MTKLYVGNLSFTATEEGVRALFAAHGTVEKVSLITDRDTGRPRASERGVGTGAARAATHVCGIGYRAPRPRSGPGAALYRPARPFFGPKLQALPAAEGDSPAAQRQKSAGAAGTRVACTQARNR